jgi:hypothetical protein
MLQKKEKVAIVGLCSDPRFNIIPGPRVEQMRAVLGVDWVVFLTKPGIVRIYQHGQDGDKEIATHRTVWESDLLIHVVKHHPCVVGIASHEECGAYHGNNAMQCKAAIIAADVLQSRLNNLYDVGLRVIPLFEGRVADDRWRVSRLSTKGTTSKTVHVRRPELVY